MAPNAVSLLIPAGTVVPPWDVCTTPQEMLLRRDAPRIYRSLPSSCSSWTRPHGPGPSDPGCLPLDAGWPASKGGYPCDLQTAANDRMHEPRWQGVSPLGCGASRVQGELPPATCKLRQTIACTNLGGKGCLPLPRRLAHARRPCTLRLFPSVSGATPVDSHQTNGEMRRRGSLQESRWFGTEGVFVPLLVGYLKSSARWGGPCWVICPFRF